MDYGCLGSKASIAWVFPAKGILCTACMAFEEFHTLSERTSAGMPGTQGGAFDLMLQRPPCTTGVRSIRPNPLFRERYARHSSIVIGASCIAMSLRGAFYIYM